MGSNGFHDPRGLQNAMLLLQGGEDQPFEHGSSGGRFCLSHPVPARATIDGSEDDRLRG